MHRTYSCINLTGQKNEATNIKISLQCVYTSSFKWYIYYSTSESACSSPR